MTFVQCIFLAEEKKNLQLRGNQELVIYLFYVALILNNGTRNQIQNVSRVIPKTGVDTSLNIFVEETADVARE